MAPQKTTLQEFEAVWPKLQESLLAEARGFKLPQNELEWYQKDSANCSVHGFALNRGGPDFFAHLEQNLETNPLGGKCNRGMSVPDSVSILLDKPLDEETYFQAATLGWVIELLQAFFLVTDDIMDGSITRRGQPCWYLQEGVGMTAINDALILESAIYTLLKKYFRSHPAYVDLLELFHEVSFQTEMGQLCDLLTAPEGKPNLDNFSMEKYKFIVIYKTAFYSFYLPVALALHQLNLATPKNLKQAEAILIPLGEYFQIQDDYLDNFGLPEHIGKVGTDIKDNKCSWLVNQALELATPEQRQILEENYGQKDDAKEAVIKKLYDDMKLKERFEKFEEDRANELKALIDNIDESEGLNKQIFEVFMSKIYKRTK